MSIFVYYNLIKLWYSYDRYEGEAIMSVLSLLLQMCAIDWFFVEGDVLFSKGKPVYPPEMVTQVAESYQVGVPHLYFDIWCAQQ